MSNLLLQTVTRLLGKKAGEYAKAVIPALATLAAVVGQWAATGALDQAELATAAIGVGASILVALTPNAKPAKK